MASVRELLSRGPRAPGTVAPAILLFTVLVAGLVLATLEGGRLGVVAGSLLVLAATVPTVVRLRWDPLDAPGIYAAVAGTMFGLLSLLWLGSPEVRPPGIGRDDISTALLIVAAGFAAVGVGAAATGKPKRGESLRFGRESVPSTTALLAVFALGGLSLAAALALGVTGYKVAGVVPDRFLPFAQALIQAAGLGTLVIAACALTAFGAESKAHKRLLPFLVAAQAMGGFIAGYKNQALVPLVVCGLAYLACGNRLPRRALVAVVAATALVLLPATLFYRNVLSDTPDGPPPDNSPSHLLEQTVGYGTMRFRLIDHVALINARTPSPYSRPSGRRYTLLPAMILVPRAVWPDKPVLNDSADFAHTYWEQPPNEVTTQLLTQPGDLLRNFGLAGVVAGLAAWGLVLGLLTTARRYWKSPRAEMLYIISLVSIVVWVESDLPQLLAGALKTLAIAAVVAWLLLPGRKSATGYHQLMQAVGRRRDAAVLPGKEDG